MQYELSNYTPLLPTLINIITGYVNAVFILDGYNIYTFDGIIKEIYYTLDKIYHNLVYSNNLYFRDKESVYCLDLQLGEASTKRIKIIKDKGDLLIGGSELYIKRNNALYPLGKSYNLPIPIASTDIKIWRWKDHIILFGAYDENGKGLSTLIYNINTCVIRYCEKISNRKDFAIVNYNNYVYVFGGSNCDSNGRVHDTNLAQRFDCILGLWYNCQRMPIRAKNIAAVTIEGKIYIIGCSPTLCYTPKTDTYTICNICFNAQLV